MQKSAFCHEKKWFEPLKGLNLLATISLQSSRPDKLKPRLDYQTFFK